MRPTHAIVAALLLITGTTVGVLAQDGDGPHPDLVPTELTNSPKDPIEDETTTFTVTIRNDGEADATTGFNVTFLVDGAQVGENKTVETLRFGDETSVTSDAWTATEGDHDIRVIVDPHDDVAESDETNNEATETVTVASAEVDLAVTELATTPEHPIENDTVTLEATVTNEGNVASNDTTLRFFVNGTALGEDVDVPALEPGETTTVSSENWTAPEGEHTIAAFVDPTHEIDEADEEDNERRETVTVEPIEANLRVESITLDPEAPSPGEGTTFTANVTNDGHTDAANVTVVFHVDGHEISNTTIESLPAGGATQVDSAAWNGSEGDHTVRVVTDVDDTVTEADETDNERARGFAVTAETEDDEGDEADDEAGDEDGNATEEEETITICHIPPGNPDARHTIEIGEPAWQAHEGHGDHQGACEEGTEGTHEDDGNATAEQESSDDEPGTSSEETESDDEEDQARGNGRGPP